MATFQSFPHYTVNVKDESATTVLAVEELPLHVPIFIGFAEKGELDVPQYGSYSELVELLGEGTFDAYSDHFKYPNVFARKALEYQKVFYVRVAPDDAATATAVVECIVTPNVMMTQYQRDSEGGIVLDGNGDPVPLEDGGVVVEEAGVQLTWRLRQLAEGETYTSLAPSTNVTTGAITYPVIAYTATSPSARMNNCGIQFWFDLESLDLDLVEDIGALMFKWAPVQMPYGYDTAQPIRDIYSNPETEFTFKEDAIDSSTDRRVNLTDLITNEYTTDPIPFNIHIYSEYVEAIGNAVITVENDITNTTYDDNLTSPYMVDIMSGTNLDGYAYHHVEVITSDPADETVVILDEDVIQYMTGGSDGDMSLTNLASLTKDWLSGTTYPDIYDEARYPITHLYDPGYPLDVKKTLIDFLSIRKDVKVVLGTQDIDNGINTKAEDQSTGAALRSQLLLHPESTIFGTQVYRGTVMQQAGYITDYNWKGIVPATIDNMIKKCVWQGASYFKGKPKGLPNSAVEIFKSINWLPSSDDHKQLSWDTGLNYMQHYDMTSWHYPDVRSIYPLETSVISDDIFTDILIYLIHIGRYQWSVFAGRDENASVLFGEIEEAIAKDIYTKFGTYVNAVIDVYQTDVDKALGYQSTVEIAVYGNLPQRVWNIQIPVRRESTENS